MKVVIFLEETRKISFEMQKRALRRAKIFSYGILVGTAGDHGGCVKFTPLLCAGKKRKGNRLGTQSNQTQAARALP